MPPLTLTYDFVFIRCDSEDFKQARFSLAAPDVCPSSLRCLTPGGMMVHGSGSLVHGLGAPTINSKLLTLNSTIAPP